ncbi:hypothetical protein [Mesorhizobium sp.]|uniref:restriction endonuclease subunit S n=1 Tax=Mesorhizobium sp. TaxID=1871066 RepID=UPI000FE8357C|nr:hypothetical protein [Mesorhizobium sp.]RWM17823.1 MAG: restriction endonuclease subunit S [Mesorhizobium sp.]
MNFKNTKLGDVAEEITVGHVGPMASEYVTSGIPFLRSQNVLPFNITTNDIRYITPTFHARLKKSSLRPGDVVIVRTGKPGTCAVIPDWLEEANCSDLVIVRCGKRAHPRYVAYWVNSLAAHHISGHIVGAVQQHFNVGAARQMPVLLPEFDGQLRILEILGSLDDKIELNRRMNETLEAMSQAIFHDWFVDFGPTRRKMEGATDPVQIMGGLVTNAAQAQQAASLFPTTLGDDGMPTGWRTRKVADVADRVAMGPFGSRITKDNFVSHGVPVIRGKNLAEGFIDHDFVYLTREKAAELSGSQARHEDIIFTHRGTLGQVGRIYPGSRYPAYVVSQSQLLLSVDRTQTSPLFLYFFFRSDDGLRKWLANSGGAGVPAIAQPTRSLKSIEFLDPGSVLAQHFDACARVLEHRACSARRESETLGSMRDLLLPKLMSGELRLRDAEAQLEAAQ